MEATQKAKKMKIYLIEDRRGPYQENGSTSFSASSIYPLRSKKQALKKFEEVKKALGVGSQVVFIESATNTPSRIFNHLHTDGSSPDGWWYHITGDHEEMDWHTNEGKDLEGAVILQCSWEKYINYASKFLGVRWGHKGETEASLIDGHKEKVWQGFEEVLMDGFVDGVTDEEILEQVWNDLDKNSWKWNHFGGHPTKEKIIDGLNLKIN